MKLKDLYNAVIRAGIENDPRGKEAVSAEIERMKKEFSDMPDKEKQFFDEETFVNPYADTRILTGSPDTEVRSVLAGIDIDTAEILLADRIRGKGMAVDMIMSHHPEGKAHAGFFNVMYMQADILNRFGVPINVAEGILQDRIKEVERRVMPANHTRAVDAAALLGIPFMCAHTPADNCVVTFLQAFMDRKDSQRVGDVIDILTEIPEYKRAAGDNNPPKIFAGAKNNRAGKVFVDMTGGTEGSEKMFEALVAAGIGTVVGMHLSEKHVQEAKKQNINIVIAGHIPSDNLGVNLLLDNIEKKEKLKVICCSGFYRVERNK